MTWNGLSTNCNFPPIKYHWQWKLYKQYFSLSSWFNRTRRSFIIYEFKKELAHFCCLLPVNFRSIKLYLAWRLDGKNKDVQKSNTMLNIPFAINLVAQNWSTLKFKKIFLKLKICCQKLQYQYAYELDAKKMFPILPISLEL